MAKRPIGRVMTAAEHTKTKRPGRFIGFAERIRAYEKKDCGPPFPNGPRESSI